MTRARNLARLVPDTSGLIPNTNLAPIAASLLTGQVADANIAAVAASKLTGQVADANIAAVTASKISGQLLDGQMSSGSVLQVVYSDVATEYTTTSTTYQNGASASITPSSASSKIMVMFSTKEYINPATSDWHHFSIYRGATQVAEYPTNNGAYTGGAAISYVMMRQGFTYLDSPSSTASVTYTLKHKTNNGSATAGMLNTQIILMEIAG